MKSGMIINSIKRFVGRFSHILLSCLGELKSHEINTLLGGGKRIVKYPFSISGVDNIVAGDCINIGQGSIIMTKRAKLIIKGHFVSGPGLTIITGDHMPVVGRFIDEITDDDKDCIDTMHQFDSNVVIEENVWCGANVTILKGVTIGRGCIIAAGSIVTRSIPPYSIGAGVPCKPIKRYWTANQIKEHERNLYPESDRIDLSSLM